MRCAHPLLQPAFALPPRHLPHPTRALRTSRASLELTSARNPHLKLARSLLRRRHRDKNNLILLEGQRLIEDALSASFAPHQLFYSDKLLRRSAAMGALLADVRRSGCAPMLVAEPIMRSLCNTVSPQGVVAVLERPALPLPDSGTLALVCDEVRDPGNVGTLLRSAAGAGVDAVLMTHGCADPWGLKVLRAGMGAHFRLPVQVDQSWDEVMQVVHKWGCEVSVADGGGEDYAKVDWCGPAAIVVGGEANGPGERAFQEAQGRVVGIPLCSGMESLNAAVAGSVVLFEVRRQRHSCVVS
ncbi:unnamed protein product [Chondrus crispus]|uniref:RNA 2-O ribose methyltransferase substrate binding domain-containing protein n=1 Tax=Chondrus crispus TaxID=2769 RepID=R7QT73_CHOCR|nr:unnamed protein product [Chondrus crispus]CDF40918.1 unnamed protein product [Chondrus crispus]|eukprot:XP_005711212.1 unnamed protein product [Chondrus crispus]